MQDEAIHIGSAKKYQEIISFLSLTKALFLISLNYSMLGHTLVYYGVI